jgi:CRISPR-associated DxTHG motif protein
LKAISFLGATQAYDTTYYLPDGRAHTAPYFPAALVRFYPIDELLVFVTAGARQMHMAQLAALVAGCVKTVRPVDIPDGRDEGELWMIFQAVADAVQAQDRVLFDITHGFRSLPFLSFLAAAYLRKVKQIDLEAVLYGALEAGDRSVKPARAPVFDLTRFVSLLDWLTAADRFTSFGDATELSRLLRDRGATPVHLAAAQGDVEAQQMAGLLRGAATAIERVSEPLRLARPIETMQAAANLETTLDAAQTEIAQWAKPLALIADQLRTAYAPFALPQPLEKISEARSLYIQRELVGWYVQQQQYMQAVTLAREWLVSYTIHALGWDMLADRKGAEDFLGADRQWRAQGGAPPDANATAVPAGVFTLWSRIPDVRNDFAHAGFRRRPRTVANLVKAARALPADLATLPLEIVS